MSQKANRPNQDSGFRQIVDQVAEKRAEAPTEANLSGVTVFTSAPQAFRYLGHLLSGR